MTVTAPRYCYAPVALAASLVVKTAVAGDAALAEELFREGRASLQAGDTARACPKLRESYEQDPATGTLLALAICQEQEGKLSSAWATYNGVVGRARQEGRADRADAARKRIEALEPRLSRLTVEVAPEVATLPGLAVTCDGALLPQAAWGSARPLDPGIHVLAATARGRTPWRRLVVLGLEADRQVVRVALDPRLQPAPSPRAWAALAPPLLAPRPTSSVLRATGLAIGAAGVIGVTAGTGFALEAISLDHRSKQNGHCDATGCDQAGQQLNRDALSAGRVATGAFIAGGALLAGGVTLFIVADRRHEAAGDSLSWVPLFELHGVGLSLRGKF